MSENCWLYTGHTNGGYGQVYLRELQGRPIYAHRLSWLLHRGQIPNGKQVLHSCDTPACINPAHLFLGSHADNMHDKKAKRRAHGGVPKLTADQVKHIRLSSETTSSLAKLFGVYPSTISDIRTKTTWKHV